MLRPLIAASLIFSAIPSAGHADDVTDKLDSGRQHYTEGRPGKAFTELQWAMVRLRARLEVLAREALPPAPAGWRIAFSQPGHGSQVGFGVQFVVNYRGEVAPPAQVSMQVSIDSPAQFGSCNNLALLNPIIAELHGYTAIDVEGLANPALLRVNEAQKSAEGIITIPGRVCIYLRGQGGNPAEAVRTLLTGWNIKRLKEAFDIR
jgi:hypothetical protein